MKSEFDTQAEATWSTEAEEEQRHRDRRDRTALAALAIEIGKRPKDFDSIPHSQLRDNELASIIEMTNIAREAREEVEDHRRMVDLMSTTNHRQRAIACIVDKMTYLELLDFAEDLFGDQSSLDAASFPSHLARWARRAKQ